MKDEVAENNSRVGLCCDNCQYWHGIRRESPRAFCEVNGRDTDCEFSCEYFRDYRAVSSDG